MATPLENAGQVRIHAKCAPASRTGRAVHVSLAMTV